MWERWRNFVPESIIIDIMTINTKLDEDYDCIKYITSAEWIEKMDADDVRKLTQNFLQLNVRLLLDVCPDAEEQMRMLNAIIFAKTVIDTIQNEPDNRKTPRIEKITAGLAQWWDEYRFMLSCNKRIELTDPLIPEDGGRVMSESECETHSSMMEIGNRFRQYREQNNKKITPKANDGPSDEQIEAFVRIDAKQAKNITNKQSEETTRDKNDLVVNKAELNQSEAVSPTEPQTEDTIKFARITKCFTSDTEEMKKVVERVVKEYGLKGDRMSGTNLARIEAVFFNHRIIKVPNEHKAFVEALVTWGIVEGPEEDIRKICSQVSTQYSAMTIKECDYKQIENKKARVCCDSIATLLNNIAPNYKYTLQRNSSNQNN